MRNGISSRRARSGFTLIEVLFVVVILGLIAALVIPNIGSRFSKGQVKTTQAMVSKVGMAVEEFRADVGRYPTEQEGLKALIERPQGVDEKQWGGPYFDKKTLPQDAWNKDFIYRLDPVFGFEIKSYGADSKEGGEGADADLSNRS
jgi:general secretion pathway protein G